MTPLEKAALDWYEKREAFLKADSNLPPAEFRKFLNQCSDGEHALADEVRKYLFEELQK
jgi:hypothetical protein